LDIFEDFAQKLEVHPLKAQILLDVYDREKAIEKALAILYQLNINWAEYRILNKSNPTLILIFLSSEDLQEAVKGLCEAGFTKLKGLNSQLNIIPKSIGG